MVMQYKAIELFGGFQKLILFQPHRLKFCSARLSGQISGATKTKTKTKTKTELTAKPFPISITRLEIQEYVLQSIKNPC